MEVEKFRTYRRLSRRANRLINDVALNPSGPCSRTELERLLREHLMLPFGADAHEPKLPFLAGPMCLKEGLARCRSGVDSVDLDSIDSGLRLMIDGLHVLASLGDRESLVTLVYVAIEAADAVNELSTSKPEIVRPVARSCEQWPLAISVHSNWQDDSIRMINDIELGTKTLFAERVHPKKSGTEGQPWRHIVPVWCERLADIVDAAQAWLDGLGMPVVTKSTGAANAARRKRWARAKRELKSCPPWLLKAGKLPELRPSTARQWFEVGWEGLKLLTKPPNALPTELTEIGVYEETRKLRKGESSLAKMRGNNVSGLGKRLQEGFMNRFGR